MSHTPKKFTAKYSKEEVNFLDFVTAGDTHQFLASTSSHPYHCKKE